MKALIRKELRENLKVTLVGLVVLLLFILVKYRDYTWVLKNQFLSNQMQPLMDDGVVGFLTFFCAIFGGLLGWLQIWNERHRDLWAFLIHRPLTRTQIFFGKTFAGLLLYLLMPGLPLLACILWVAIPGHVPAPFEWSMVLPITAAFLGGVVYYFAGMLTGLREARWYASRCLGLVMAILVSIKVLNTSFEFWHALIAIAAGVAILATAVWGAFRSEGHYEGQPVSGKAALTTVLGAGLALVVFIVTLLALAVALRGIPGEEWSRYVMTKGGAIYKATTGGNGRSENWRAVVDLNHERIPEGKAVGGDNSAFLRGESTTSSIHLSSPYGWRRGENFLNCYRFFAFWRNSPGTIWYYSRSHSCLVAYDLATRRFIGSLGPDGFSQAPTAAADDSHHLVEQDWLSSGRTIATSNAIYEVDLDRRVTQRIFTSDNERILAARNLLKNGTDLVYTLVVTEHSVVLLDPQGTLVWRRPFQPIRGLEDQVKVSTLEPAGQFAIWVSERARTNLPVGASPPMLVTWFGSGQAASPSVELPAMLPSHGWPTLGQKLLCAPLPPVSVAAMPLLDGSPWPSTIPKELLEMLRLSLIVALVCVPVVWWLGRRYHFSVAAKVSWVGFIVLTGIPGLLAFLSVQEWPAREPCPRCRKLRLVDRERCEHCGAEFPPPEMTGTEIFESAGKAPG